MSPLRCLCLFDVRSSFRSSLYAAKLANRRAKKRKQRAPPVLSNNLPFPLYHGCIVSFAGTGAFAESYKMLRWVPHSSLHPPNFILADISYRVQYRTETRCIFECFTHGNLTGFCRECMYVPACMSMLYVCLYLPANRSKNLSVTMNVG